MKNYLLIIRPFNCLFIGFAVLTGAMLNNQIEDFTSLFFGLFAALFIAGGGYVINDFYDLPTDMLNKPHRIIPSGGMAPDRAYIFAMFLFALGFSLSFFTANLWAILIAILNSLLLYFYAKHLKKTVLIGNLTISYTTASAFLFGAIIGDNLINMLPIIIFTFLYTMVREIIKDAEDVKGDKKVGIKTLGTLLGQQKATIISVIPAALLALSLYIAYQEDFLSRSVFLIISILYVIPLTGFFIRLFHKISTASLKETAILIKLHMLVLLVVLIIVS